MASGAYARIAAHGVAREEAVCFIPISESQPNLRPHMNPNPNRATFGNTVVVRPKKRMGRGKKKFDCLPILEQCTE